MSGAARDGKLIRARRPPEAKVDGAGVQPR
jgi:hypothetical protein